MTHETGKIAVPEPVRLYGDAMLSEFGPYVKYDMPVDELLRDISIGKFVVVPLQRAPAEYVPPGTEIRYWRMCAPVDDGYEQSPQDGFGTVRHIASIDICPAADFTDASPGRYWPWCRKLVTQDLSHRKSTDEAIRELSREIGADVLQRVSFAMSPVLSGVAYQFRREPDGGLTKAASQLFFSRHLIRTGDRVRQRLDEIKKAQNQPPAWMVKAALPYRKQEAAKQMALSILALAS